MKLELKYLKHGDMVRLAKVLHKSEGYKGLSFSYCYQKLRDAKRGYIVDPTVVDALEKLNEARRIQVESNSMTVVNQIINQ